MLVDRIAHLPAECLVLNIMIGLVPEDILHEFGGRNVSSLSLDIFPVVSTSRHHGWNAG